MPAVIVTDFRHASYRQNLRRGSFPAVAPTAGVGIVNEDPLPGRFDLADEEMMNVPVAEIGDKHLTVFVVAVDEAERGRRMTEPFGEFTIEFLEMTFRVQFEGQT